MYATFNDVAIDHEDISQGDLNIDNKVRSNLFAWNGQFSPQFIETLLLKYSKKKDIIFDPFLGSGTTLYEAARRGLSAFGTELNISAYYMSKTYELINLDLESRKNLLSNTEDILHEIHSENEIISNIVDVINYRQNDPVSNILSTLVIVMDIFNNELSFQLLDKKWARLKEMILELPWSQKEIKAFRGDARMIAINDNSATMLITSPPYINVFNYHQKYRKSVEALGYDVLTIAKNEFGSNRKYRCNRLCTVIQYCIDMALSVSEACRICKDGSRMIYVVGRESNVLGYSFCNSQLIYEICEEIFALPFELRQERVFKNRYGQMIYEDILHFRSRKPDKNLDSETIKELARKIAGRMLLEKRNLFPESKNTPFLDDALAKINNIQESEG